MFKTLRPILLISVGIAFALASSVMVPSFSQGQLLPSATATPEVITVTATAVQEAEKVPGDTNIILLLGAVLVVIIITAIMWHRRDWER
jgi:hypothetical protein